MNFAAGIRIFNSYVSALVLGPVGIGQFQSINIVKSYVNTISIGESEALRVKLPTLNSPNSISESTAWINAARLTCFATIVSVILFFLTGQKLLGLNIIFSVTVITCSVLYVIEYLIQFETNLLKGLGEFDKVPKAYVLSEALGLFSIPLLLIIGYNGFLIQKIIISVTLLFFLKGGLSTGWQTFSRGWRIEGGKILAIAKVGFPLQMVLLSSVGLGLSDRLAAIIVFEAHDIGVYSSAGMLAFPFLNLANSSLALSLSTGSQTFRDKGVGPVLRDFLSKAENHSPRVAAMVILISFVIKMFMAKIVPNFASATPIAIALCASYGVSSVLAAFSNILILQAQLQRLIALNLFFACSNTFVCAVVGRMTGELRFIAVTSSLMNFIFGIFVYFSAVWPVFRDYKIILKTFLKTFWTIFLVAFIIISITIYSPVG